MATLINFNQLGFQAGNYPIFRQNHNHRPSFWPFIHLAASLWRPLMSTFVPLGISPSGISWLNQLEHDPKRMPRSRACVQDPAPPPSLSLFFWGFVQLTCYNICSPQPKSEFWTAQHAPSALWPPSLAWPSTWDSPPSTSPPHHFVVRDSSSHSPGEGRYALDLHGEMHRAPSKGVKAQATVS